MLTKKIKALSPVPISEIRPSIDRIQISIRNTTEANDLLESLLSSSCEDCDIKKVNGRLIKRYLLGGCLVVHMRGTYRWQWLILYQPTLFLQNLIRKGIEPLMGLNDECYTYVNIQQVEFAYDVFPLFYEDLFDLDLWLKMVTFLRYSRKDSFKALENSFYQGSKGNVRKGSCGLTQYKKEAIINFARLEIQLNNRSLKKEICTLESLPVIPSSIDPLKYVVFRKPLSRCQFNTILNNSFYSKYPYDNRESIMKKKGVSNSHWNIASDDMPFLNGIYCQSLHDIDIPVANQISIMKSINDRYKLNLNLKTIFPILT